MIRNKRNLIKHPLTLTVMGFVCAFSNFSIGNSQQPFEAIESTTPMTTAAENDLNTLNRTQMKMGTWPVDSEERFDWHFIPRARRGIPLKSMTQHQRSAAHALLRNSLSSQGYMKATGIMQLEGILGVMEGSPERRDPEDYYWNIFGTPASTNPWGWRFEGHHVSLNFSVGGHSTSGHPEGLPSITPAFLVPTLT